MVSFVATAIITFIAIVIGYLSDSLPDTCLSQLDRACIAKFSTIRWRPWIKDGPMNLLLRRSMTVAMGVSGWDYAVADHNKGLEDDDTSRDARERRSKGLEKFILALSDQQLVTGLAVLIAGYISPCSMSIYHFRIIAALGWFSSTVHLSTLSVLRVYFIEHPRLRDWRVVAMLFVLVLLIVAQLVPGPTQEQTAAAESHASPRLDNSLPVRCALTHGSFVMGPLPTVAIITFLVVTYSNGIIRLYVLDPEWSIQEWFVDAVLRLFTGSPWRSIRNIVIESSNKTKTEQGVVWRSMIETRRYGKRYKIRKSSPGKSNLTLVMTREIQNSFLGNLLMLQFGVTFGITQVIVSRIYEPSAGIVGSQNDINFGQLVPLLLMLLPLFAAGEVYFGNSANLYAYGLVLTGLVVERHEDMSTRRSNDEETSINNTRGKPFFSRKIGLADLFELPYSTQTISNNTSLIVGASSLLQAPGGVSPSEGGSNQTELQNLPTGRLRRPDTETGQRASVTAHTPLAGTPYRDPTPDNGTQSAKVTEKPPSPWGGFIFVVVCYTSFQTLIAVTLGGAPLPWIFRLLVIIESAVLFFYTLILGPLYDFHIF